MAARDRGASRSVAAVVIAVMANQSSLGWRRDQMATADLVQQANRLQAVARESQNEARRLASAIDTLNSDRDRLYSRVTVLEQGLDSVTGAIAKQSPPSSSAAPTAARRATRRTAPSRRSRRHRLRQPTRPPSRRSSQRRRTSPASPRTQPAHADTLGRRDAGNKPAVTPATPLVESKSIMAPPDPAASKLIEPDKPAERHRSGADAGGGGGGASDGGRRAGRAKYRCRRSSAPNSASMSAAPIRSPACARCGAGCSSRANAPLAALQPIIVIKEGTGGLGMQLRLVAGPLQRCGGGGKICAVMSEKPATCETAVFDGQRLSMDCELSRLRRRTARAHHASEARRKRAAVEEPAKKPRPRRPATSSFFGKKSSQ